MDLHRTASHDPVRDAEKLPAGTVYPSPDADVRAAEWQRKEKALGALESLPKISAVFGEGRLSYSKVRALTRVATAAAASPGVIVPVMCTPITSGIGPTGARQTWTTW